MLRSPIMTLRKKNGDHSEQNYLLSSMETVICEYCGKEMPREEATCVEGGMYFACERCAEIHLTHCARCGEVIDYDEAYSSPYGRLCECCHDDLFG